METHTTYPRIKVLAKIVGSAVLVGYGLIGPMLEDMIVPVLADPYSHSVAHRDIVTFPVDNITFFDGSETSIQMASALPSPTPKANIVSYPNMAAI